MKFEIKTIIFLAHEIWNKNNHQSRIPYDSKSRVPYHQKPCTGSLHCDLSLFFWPRISVVGPDLARPRPRQSVCSKHICRHCEYGKCLCACCRWFLHTLSHCGAGNQHLHSGQFWKNRVQTHILFRFQKVPKVSKSKQTNKQIL